MNANSTFLIGADHTVCEDFALAGTIPDWMSYAIVCDGCSASDDVDMGSRILAFSTKECISEDYQWDHNNAGNRVGKFAITNAWNMCKTFFPTAIYPMALDATLLAARVKDNKAIAVMYGDGVFIHRSKNFVKAYNICVTSGAPDYLSYTMNEERMKSYLEIENNTKQVSIVTRTGELVENEIMEFPVLTPFYLNIDVVPGDVIAVISDGINSFTTSDGTPISWMKLINEFTGFKNFNGEFVLRRISSFKRDCIKNGITHSDDISISAIVV